MELEPCEFVLEDDAERLWRQVHPEFVQGHVVLAGAFVGTPTARSKVSTVRSSVRTAKQAFDHHTTLGLTSAGSWAITVDEMNVAGCQAIDDAACEGVETPGHSYIDMRGLSKPARKLARATLAQRATQRGRQFPGVGLTGRSSDRRP
ncbi:MAG: hypothetical protein MSC31_16245 [Solirubrobacteraceae bacterium MAG38_C4-C5]|nr:hypothetical protein [Candidatus Siliceabacter maunaloa]